MSNILVTGGSGLLGMHVVRALAERGDNVISFDVAPPSDPRRKWFLEPVIDRVKSVEGTITDLAYLVQTVKKHRVEKIAHIAAIYNPVWEKEHPRYALEVSLMGCVNICEVARLMDVQRVVFASSHDVYYAQPRCDPLDEDHPTFSPTSGNDVYATGKVAGEAIGMAYFKDYDLDWIALRFSGMWGFGAKPETTFGMALAAEAAVDGRPYSLPQIYYWRDYTYVKDNTQGVLKALDVKEVHYRAFNVTSGEQSTNADVIRAIKELVPEAEIELGPVPEKWPTYGSKRLNISRARDELGYEPRYVPIRVAFKDYMDLYRAFIEAQKAKQMPSRF